MIALRKVRMHDDATHKGFAVVNDMVTGEVLANALIGQVGVGDDGRGLIDRSD